MDHTPNQLFVMPKEKGNGDIKMSFVSVDSMEKDLRGSSRRGRNNPLYDKVIEKVLKIDKKPLAIEVTPKQRTGIMGKMKKMGLLATRKDPDRSYSVKFKILERNDAGKAALIRMYIIKNAE